MFSRAHAAAFRVGEELQLHFSLHCCAFECPFLARVPSVPTQRAIGLCVPLGSPDGAHDGTPGREERLTTLNMHNLALVAVSWGTWRELQVEEAPRSSEIAFCSRSSKLLLLELTHTDKKRARNQSRDRVGFTEHSKAAMTRHTHERCPSLRFATLSFLTIAVLDIINVCTTAVQWRLRPLMLA